MPVYMRLLIFIIDRIVGWLAAPHQIVGKRKQIFYTFCFAVCYCPAAWFCSPFIALCMYVYTVYSGPHIDDHKPTS